jgi:type IV secretory pathway ATPase VirB11/archaellum biosynthesis ATPase
MIIEQTIEIPDSHRVYVDLPPQIPVGTARIAIRIIEYPGADDDIEAFSDEAEATEFATRLSKRIIHEAW